MGYCLFIAVIASLAQTAAKKLGNMRYIDVTGTAEKEVVLDEIYITITLTERYEGRDKVDVNEQEKAVKENQEVVA